jgi:tRNA (guanine37-N1)-methyltransferase
MKFKVITLFPDFIKSLENYSIIGRAIKNRVIKLETINLRDFGIGSYKQVDDRPYGGGIGMLMRVDVMHKAIKKALGRTKKAKVILLSPDGKKFTQKMAKELCGEDELILVCGHYEGFDKRIESYVDEKVSIGDFVLTGGEIASMAMIDAISRQIDGVLGKNDSKLVETFSEVEGEIISEYPQFTRPELYDGIAVPETLLCGDPKKVTKWQTENTRYLKD